MHCIFPWLSGLKTQFILDSHRVQIQKMWFKSQFYCIQSGKPCRIFSLLASSLFPLCKLDALLPASEDQKRVKQKDLTWHASGLRAQALNQIRQTLISFPTLLFMNWLAVSSHKSALNLWFPTWNRRLVIVFFSQGGSENFKQGVLPVLKVPFVSVLTKELRYPKCPRGYCCFFTVLLSVSNWTKDNHASIVSEPPGCSY